MRLHRVDQVHGADDVVFVVQQRLLDRLAHGLQSAEVDDRVEAIRCEQRVEAAGIAQIAFDEIERSIRDTANRVE